MSWVRRWVWAVLERSNVSLGRGSGAREWVIMRSVMCGGRSRLTLVYILLIIIVQSWSASIATSIYLTLTLLTPITVATHSMTGHKVAMKIINRRKIQHMEMTSRVKREIQYLKVLRHPHIIKLYEVITTSTDIIMVIEYAGQELFEYIVNKGRMEEDEARRFFQQIICAIEYCHRHKIVHRDLKPEK